MLNDLKENILKHMQNLISKIRHYNYMYYIKNINEISDLEYDKLLQELINIEQQYPQFAMEDSPTNRIGHLEELNGKLIKRKIPMLSLKHTYEISEFIEICSKFLEKDQIIIEPKIDGVAITIIYANGYLESISLRGDGTAGEDITGQVFFIQNITTKIDGFSGEVRGEVIIENHHEITNRRNFVSGALRHKNPSNQNLKFIPYKLLFYDNLKNIQSQSESLIFISKYFEIAPHKIINNLDNLQQEIEEFSNIKFPYDTDGIVAKIDNIEIFESMGYSNRYPKGAIALKIISDSHISKIINIEWEINRRGRYVPVAVIEQLIIDNSKINKIYLHNARFITNNMIGIGSEVEVTKIGNIIPKITKVLTNREYIFPDICNFCQSKLILGEIDLYCDNLNCNGIFFQKAIYFMKELGINNMSKDSLQRIIIGLNINNYFDLLNILLDSKWIVSINDKKAFISIKKLVGIIKLSKLLIAFGIDGVGPEILNDILNLNLTEIINLQSNLKKIKNLQEYINNNKEMIEKICDLIKVSY